MKWFITGTAIVIMCLNWLCFKQDNNLHQQQMKRLKTVTQEAAAAGAQYYDKSQYRYGKLVFNQAECIKAAQEIIKYNLKLDNSFKPLANTYWQDQTQYTITFFDDSLNMYVYTNGVFTKQQAFTYPYLYIDPSGSLTQTIINPTVVVYINAGKPRYRTISTFPNVYRVAAHEWKPR